ncbi:unnamed protein product [Ectocarpus sp. 12 AP-2014]
MDTKQERHDHTRHPPRTTHRKCRICRCCVLDATACLPADGNRFFDAVRIGGKTCRGPPQPATALTQPAARGWTSTGQQIKAHTREKSGATFPRHRNLSVLGT